MSEHEGIEFDVEASQSIKNSIKKEEEEELKAAAAEAEAEAEKKEDTPDEEEKSDTEDKKSDAGDESDDEEKQVVEEAAAAPKKEETKSGGGKKTVVPGIAVEDDGVRVIGVHISQLRMPLVGMFVSAIVLLAAVLSVEKTIRYPEYAISVPSVTMVLSFILICVTCKESFYKKFGKIPNQVLFLWNFIGAILLTFIDPFTGTGNGYFASWMMVVCSAAALGLSHSVFTSSVQGMGALLGLLSCSIIVIIAIAPYIGKNKPYRNESIYTIATASFTLAIILLHIFLEKKKGIDKSGGIVAVILLGFFAILWLALAGLTTFRGPFLVTGNGYFGSWAGAACACFAAMAAMKKKKQGHVVET